MEFLPFYKSTLALQNEDDVFNYLMSTLKPSNVLWSYFVNWEKVFENTKKFEAALNTLNYLIGKEDFDNEFRFVLKENPKLAQALPALVVRGSNKKNIFNILVDYKNKRLSYEEFDFTKKQIEDADIESYLRFVKETGLKELISSKKIKNLVDYLIGVEAGLDSNGRKNRGGHAMEDIVEVFIKDFCSERGYKYLKEANSKKIFEELGHSVPVDRSSRRYDFVISTGSELVIFETNFYGGGGSKLKSTAGEYRNLFDVLKGQYKFVWITDGMGWKTASRPLRETFSHNSYVVNLAMIEQGLLPAII